MSNVAGTPSHTSKLLITYSNILKQQNRTSKQQNLSLSLITSQFDSSSNRLSPSTNNRYIKSGTRSSSPVFISSKNVTETHLPLSNINSDSCQQNPQHSTFKTTSNISAVPPTVRNVTRYLLNLLQRIIEGDPVCFICFAKLLKK